MYVSGHILTSVLSAQRVAKSFKLSFGSTAAIMIAASLVDADHLFYYYLDNGTASSFELHPLHKVWYLTIGMLLGSGLLFKRVSSYIWVASAGLGLHFAMDFIADAIHYNLYAFIVIDILLYIVAMFAIKCKKESILFLTSSLVVPYVVNGTLLYGLGIAVDSSMAYHIATIIMVGMAALFARKTLK